MIYILYKEDGGEGGTQVDRQITERYIYFINESEARGELMLIGRSLQVNPQITSG